MVHGGRASGNPVNSWSRVPWGRLGSLLYTVSRLRRVRPGSGHNRPFSAVRLIKPHPARALDGPKRQRMRCRWLPTIRATPQIYIRKSK